MGNLLGGSLIGAGINAISGLWQNKQNQKMMREQMAWQTKEREASQAYQTGEREAAQTWNTKEREAQNKYGEDMYNKYQSPFALAKQYKDAGLNPLLASGSAGAGAIGSASGSNVGMSQGSAPQSHGVTAPYQNIGVYSDMLSTAIGNLKTLGEARKAGVDAFVAEQAQQDIIKQIHEYLRGTQIENDLAEFTSKIDKENYSKKVDLLLKNLAQDLENKKVTVSEARARIEKIGKEAKLDQLEIDNFYKKLQGQLDLWASEENKNYSDANLKDKQAITEQGRPDVLKSEVAANYSVANLNAAQKELINSNKKIADANAIIVECDAFIKQHTYKTEKNTHLYELRKKREQVNEQIKILKEQREIYEKENDWYNAKACTELISEWAKVLGPIAALAL